MIVIPYIDVSTGKEKLYNAREVENFICKAIGEANSTNVIKNKGILCIIHKTIDTLAVNLSIDADRFSPTNKVGE